MGRTEDYAVELRSAANEVEYLRTHSGLPGPRGNLELVQAAADVGEEPAFREWIRLGAGDGPTDEYLAVCGIVGLGRLVSAGRSDIVEELREHAADARWRVREAVAMALQRVGDADIDRLLRILESWTEDRGYVQRAAVAAIAEPRLLKTEAAGRAAVDLVDHVTTNLSHVPDRRSDEFRTLRQALAYCWSVVVAGAPTYGWPRLERWFESADPDVRWLLGQNLKKNRMIRLDPARVERLQQRLA
jgi:hypothetical protein